MAKRQIFYSFHYANDVFRVQQIRNIGALEENKPVSHNDWEQVKKGGDAAIEKWIDESMKFRSCVIVLIGAETASRKWVDYEIRKGWNDKKGILGIYIHNLKDPRTSQIAPFYGKSSQGVNPFNNIKFTDGRLLSSVAMCYNPSTDNAYKDIAENLEDWIEQAITIRNTA